ncbi:MAG: translocation/assembly module TamB domain-containing protein [Sphingobacteriales bacterium]|nr:MAG: translocation/assembly module TamB domain-containing protein [Sphingobacteriales bacterium]
MKKITISILVALVLAVVVFLWQINRPATQTFLIRKALTAIGETYGIEATVGKINIRFFNRIEIDQLYLSDQQSDTLVYIRHLDLHIPLWSLLKKQIVIDELSLSDSYLNIYRNKSETAFNYDFFLSGESTSSSQTYNDTLPVWLHLNKLNLTNTRVSYNDIPGGQQLSTTLKRLSVAFEDIDLNQSHFALKNLLLDDAEIQVAIHQPDSLTLAKLPARTQPATDASENKAEIQLFVKNTDLESICLSYEDNTQNASDHEGIDFARIHLNDFNGNVKDLYFTADTLSFAMNNFAFSEHSGFVCKNLSAQVQYQPTGLGLNDFYFETPQSEIRAGLTLVYPDTEAFTSSPDLVDISLDLPQLTLNTNDLRFFYPEIDKISYIQSHNQTFNTSLILHGTLDDLMLNEFAFQCGNNRMDIDQLHLKHPTNTAQLNFFAKGLKVISSAADLQTLVDPSLIPEQLNPLGEFSLSGNIQGGMTKIAANLHLSSEAGQADTETTLWMENIPRYKGQISLKEFEAGKIAGFDSIIGKLTLQTIFDLEGTELATLFGTANLNIDEASLMGYNYQKTNADFVFNQNIIETSLFLGDKNAAAEIKTFVNLRTDMPELNTSANIKHLNTSALGLYQWDYAFRGNLNAKLSGNHTDNISGTLSVSDAGFIKNETIEVLNSLKIDIDQSNEANTFINLISDIADLQVQGNFKPTQVASGLFRCLNRYYQIFPDTVSKLIPLQQIEFSLKTKQVDLLQNMFVPGLKRLDSCLIKGNFDEVDNKISLTTDIDYVEYENYKIEQVNLDLNNQNNRITSQLILNNLHIKSDTTTTILPEITLATNIANDSLLLGVRVMSDETTTALSLSDFLVALEKDEFVIELLDEALILNNHLWEIQKGNLVRIQPKGILVNRFKLGYGNGQITISNKEAGDVMSPLLIKITDFEINDLAQLASLDSLNLSGRLTGDIEIAEPMGNLSATAGFQFTDLLFSGIQLNKAELTTAYNQSGKIPVDFAVSDGMLEGSVRGNYNLNQPEKALDFNLFVKSFDLSSLEQFVQGTASDLKGYLSGNLQIKGSTDAPELKGGLELNNSTVKVDMTNSSYSLEALKLEFEQNAITLKPAVITDQAGGKLSLHGQFLHKNFEDIGINFQANGKNLQLMNTKSAVEGMPVYGVLNGNLEVKVSGTEKQPDIKVFFETGNHTDLYMTVPESTTEIKKSELVVFGSQDPEIDAEMQKSAEEAQTAQPVSLKPPFKYDLTLKLTATNEARINIIMDPAAGDQITCSGDGDITVDTNETGNLVVAGDYTIQNGSYQMTLQDVIKRRFEIEKGSTLNFAGDPMDSRFNITAIYEPQTSVYEMVSEFSDQLSEEEISKLKRRQPVQVALNIKGTIAAPKLTFNILLPKLQDEPNPLLERKLAQIRENETELNKQSFGLIMFNRFIPAGGAPTLATPDAESMIYSSLSKMVSDQLNNMAGKYVKGMEIMVNVEADGTGDDRNRELQYGVSQSLFNERITVQIGGTVALDDQQQNNSGLAPDVAIEYKITKDGKVKGRVFRKDRYHQLSQLYRPTTGIGISYKKKFGKFKELFKKQKK